MQGYRPKSEKLPAETRSPRIKVTEEQKDEIRQLARQGVTQAAIARMFQDRGIQIGQPRVHNIIHNKRYSNGNWKTETMEEVYGDVHYAD